MTNQLTQDGLKPKAGHTDLATFRDGLLFKMLPRVEGEAFCLQLSVETYFTMRLLVVSVSLCVAQRALPERFGDGACVSFFPG